MPVMSTLRWPTYPSRNLRLESGTQAASLHVKDDQGRVYLDCVAGIGCAVLGHGHATWIRAVEEQLSKIACMANSYDSTPRDRLAQRLAEISPVQDGRVFFANSGAESTEAALKICLKATGRNTILAFGRAFHGRTLGALSLTDNPKYRQPYIDCVEEDTSAFAQCKVIRVPFGDEAAVREAFQKHGSSLAAVFIEPIQGEGGVFPATREFLLALRELCNSHGVLLAVDEIQTGIGRTGHWTAWEHLCGDQAPVDVIWYAKALGNGYPIGACVARAELAEHMGLGTHGTTFGGNPVACAAALATLEIIESEGLLQSAGAQIGILRALAEAAPIPQVSEIRGAGSMIGIQFGERKQALAKPLGAELIQQGVLVTVPGGHTVRSLLPYAAKEAELRELWEALGRASRNALVAS